MYLESVRVAIDTSFHDEPQLGHQRGQIYREHMSDMPSRCFCLQLIKTDDEQRAIRLTDTFDWKHGSLLHIYDNPAHPFTCTPPDSQHAQLSG
jgi:hypothetical protein